MVIGSVFDQWNAEVLPPTCEEERLLYMSVYPPKYQGMPRNLGNDRLFSKFDLHHINQEIKNMIIIEEGRGVFKSLNVCISFYLYIFKYSIKVLLVRSKRILTKESESASQP